MKKILGKLATVLFVIETIILLPVDFVVALILKLILHSDEVKFCDAYANYSWLMRGWWLKTKGISKEDERFIICQAMLS